MEALVILYAMERGRDLCWTRTIYEFDSQLVVNMLNE